MTNSTKLKVGFLSCVGLAILSASSLAQPAQPTQPAGGQFGAESMGHPVPIRDGKVYFLTGGGSTATIIIGDKGVIVVDPKTTMASGQRLIQEIATLTPKPVTHIIETHSDCDHSNGIVAFPRSVQLIAHVNNRREQEQIARLATVEIDGGHGVAPQDRLANVLITKNGQTATINGVRLVFYHLAPAHTSGDLQIYLPDEKVMVAGDMIQSNHNYGPNVRDYGLLFKFEKNGSPTTWFENAEQMLKTDADVYVTGHGDATLTKPYVRKLVDDFRAEMLKVDALAASGKSLEETTKAMGDKPVDLLANNITPATIKECPRATIAMSASWIRWHEWQYAHRTLEAMGSNK